MRSHLIALGCLAAGFSQVAFGNIVLEDFKTGSASHYKNETTGLSGYVHEAQNGEPSLVYRITGSVQLNNNTGGFTNYMYAGMDPYSSLYLMFGAEHNGWASFSANTDMNADLSNVTAIRIHFTSAAGGIRLDSADLYTNNSGTYAYRSASKSGVALSAGNLDIPISDFSTNAAVNMSDIDVIAIYLSSFNGAGAIGIDSIELITATPEPASLAVAGIGAGALLMRRRKA